MARFALRELDGVQARLVGLLQEEEVAALVDDADGHLHIAVLGFPLGGGGHGLDCREVQVLARGKVGSHGDGQDAEEEWEKSKHGNMVHLGRGAPPTMM